MAQNIKVDFRYFITSALQNKITWEALDHFLNDLTPTLATSKQVIKVLLKELQKLQCELQEIRNGGLKDDVQVLNDPVPNNAENNVTPVDVTENHEFDQFAGEQDQFVLEQVVQEQSIQDGVMEASSISPKSSEEEDLSNFPPEENFHIIQDQKKKNDVGIKSQKKNKKIIKMFECQICQKAFKVKADLKRHFSSHSSEKPYHCQYCPRSFKVKISKETHERSHMGEFPFQCNLCSKKYTSVASLRSH